MGKKRIYNYLELKEQYDNLLNEKSDIIELKQKINKQNIIIKKLRKDKIELSYLITELMKRK